VLLHFITPTQILQMDCFRFLFRFCYDFVEKCIALVVGFGFDYRFLFWSGVYALQLHHRRRLLGLGFKKNGGGEED